MSFYFEFEELLFCSFIIIITMLYCPFYFFQIHLSSMQFPLKHLLVL